MALLGIPSLLRITLTGTRHCARCGIRTASTESHRGGTMGSWQLNKYGGYSALQLSDSFCVPTIRSPDDILVRVHAASLNPIDVKVMEGYGASIFNTIRKVQGVSHKEFPIIPGRDFSGTVVSTGHGGSASRFKPGDEVWGATMPVRSHGTMAEYVLVPQTGVYKKPKSLSHTEAASLPYVGLTVWSALCTSANLSATNTRGKRILVLGGSGGIGTFAIQLLKAWGAEVTTTCSADAIELVSKLGADITLDYRDSDTDKNLAHLKGFDVIFDTTGDQPDRYMKLLSSRSFSTYVTITTPMMVNADNYGFLPGMAKTALTLVPHLLKGVVSGHRYRYAFVQDSQKCLRTMTDLVNTKQIVPVIDQTFGFDDVPAAYEKQAIGRNRGKNVVNVINDTAHAEKAP